MVTTSKTTKQRATTAQRQKLAKASFLKALANLGHVGKAADAAGMDRDTFYKWRQNDPAFASAWEVAREQFIRGDFEAHVIDLAFNGYVEVKTKRERDASGQWVEVERTMVNKKFPTLAMRILERRHPDYMPREERVVSEVDVHKDDDLDVSQLSREEAAELTRLLMKAAPKAA